MAASRWLNPGESPEPVVCLEVGNEVRYLLYDSRTNRIRGRVINRDVRDPPNFFALDKGPRLFHFSLSPFVRCFSIMRRPINSSTSTNHQAESRKGHSFERHLGPSVVQTGSGGSEAQA
jgi:hypothetical protein